MSHFASTPNLPPPKPNWLSGWKRVYNHIFLHSFPKPRIFILHLRTRCHILTYFFLVRNGFIWSYSGSLQLRPDYSNPSTDLSPRLQFTLPLFKLQSIEWLSVSYPSSHQILQTNQILDSQSTCPLPLKISKSKGSLRCTLILLLQAILQIVTTVVTVDRTLQFHLFQLESNNEQGDHDRCERISGEGFFLKEACLPNLGLVCHHRVESSFGEERRCGRNPLKGSH